MGFMVEESIALLQESFGGGGTQRLAEAMYTLLNADTPIKITSPVEITVGGNRITAPLTLNNYTASPVSFQINHGNNVFNTQTGQPLPGNVFGDINFGDINSGGITSGFTFGGGNIMFQQAGAFPRDQEINPNNGNVQPVSRDQSIAQILEAIIESVGDNTLSCNIGSGTVTVRKPAELRGGATTRTVTVRGFAEAQTIIPEYKVGAIIYIGKLASAVSKADRVAAANKADRAAESATEAASSAVAASNDDPTNTAKLANAAAAEAARDSLIRFAEQARSVANSAPIGDYVDLNADARAWCVKIPGDET